MPSAYVPAKLRRLVIKRAGGHCEYCLSPVSHAVSSFAMEHILPLEKGGKTSAGNLALSCQGCTLSKQPAPLASSEMERTFQLEPRLLAGHRTDADRARDRCGFAS